MATAEELLASLSDDDRMLIIDSDLRTIKIPSAITNLGVESDDEVLTVYFQMPSTYCGVDLSKFRIRINYLNAASQGDYHDVDDAMQQSDGTIRFSWTIGRHAASVVGNVEFNVCLKLTDSTGAVLKEFNTTPATLPILRGLEISDQVILEYNDILEQWRAKLFGIGDTEEGKILAVSAQEQRVIANKSAEVLRNIELKGSETLVTIPETYTEVYDMAEEALRTKADAIVIEAEGSVISVDDASDDYIKSLKLYGKSTQVKTNGYQLFNADWLPTLSSNGATVRNNGDGSFTVTGSGALTAGFTIKHVVPHDEMVRLLKAGKTTLYSGQTTFPYLSVTIRNNSQVYGEVTNHSASSSSVDIKQEWLNDSDAYLSIVFYGSAGGAITSGTIKPMLYQDGDGAWEPFTGGKPGPNPDYPREVKNNSVTQARVCGNNLCPETDVEFVQHVFIPLGMTYNPGKYRLSAVVSSTDTDSDQTAVMFYMDDTITGSIFLTRNTTGERVAGTANLYQPFNKLRFYAGYGWSVSEGDTAMITDLKLELYPGTSEYEEPTIQDIDINISSELSGIPVESGGNYTDDNGQQWICDEVDLERGVYIKRVKSVTYNGEDSEYVAAYGLKNNTFAVSNKSNDYLRPIETTDTAAALCDKLVASNTHIVYAGTDNGIFGFSTSGNSIRFTLDTLNDYTPDQVRAWLKDNPLTFYYALATPIETPLAVETIAAFKALRTNRYNTTILNDADAWMSVKYAADTKTYIENPKTLKLVDSSTGVVYELKIVDGSIAVTPV